MKMKDSIALAGGKLVVMGFIVGENETRSLLCCGNCNNYDLDITYGHNNCKNCGWDNALNGSYICDKWEIRE